MKRIVLSLLLCLSMVVIMFTPINMVLAEGNAEGNMVIKITKDSKASDLSLVPGKSVTFDFPKERPDFVLWKNGTAPWSELDTESDIYDVFYRGSDTDPCVYTAEQLGEYSIGVLWHDETIGDIEKLAPDKVINIANITVEDENTSQPEDSSSLVDALKEYFLNFFEKEYDTVTFTEEETATFTQGVTVDGVQLKGKELGDYLESLSAREFVLAVNQMSFFQSGSLESAIPDGLALRIATAIRHDGYPTATGPRAAAESSRSLLDKLKDYFLNYFTKEYDAVTFFEEEKASFTQGVTVDGVQLKGKELDDYLESLSAREFVLAVNQMSFFQSGSLESAIPDGLALRIATAIRHDGYPVNKDVTVTTATAKNVVMRTASTKITTIDYPEWPNPGSIHLDKKANSVPGNDELWEITLDIQGRNFETTSDVVMVIDNSNSMYSGDNNMRMVNTKIAAKVLADKLWADGENRDTRIAVVVFGSGVVDSTQFYTYETITEYKNYIDSINQYGEYVNGNDGGGTNIQASLHKADEILFSDISTGRLKNIILLADGEATYCCEVTGITNVQQEDNCGRFNHKVNITSADITSCDYNNTIGPGSSMDISTNQRYQYETQCSHSKDCVATYPPTTDIPTIWEAQQTKNKGTTIHSIGLEAGEEGERLLKACASPADNDNNYHAATSSANMEETLFEAVAGNIAAAATNCAVTDPMGDKVNLAFTGSVPTYTNNLQDYIDGIADIYISQGTLTYDSETETINWDVGRVKEGIDPVMKYKIKLDPDANVQTGEQVDTNNPTFFDYKDYQDHEAQKEFPIPKITVGGGTILVHYYRVNEQGQPVNSYGEVVASPALAEQLQAPLYWEEGGNSALGYGTYIVTNETFPQYVYFKHSVNNGELTDGASADVTLNQANSNQDVWFAYYKVDKTTLTIKKEGWNSIDENQTFLFHVTGNGVDLIVTVHGNGETTIADLPVGTYTVEEITEWSWRYDPTDENKTQTVEVPPEGKTVTFTNTRNEDKWLDGDNYEVNEFAGVSE